MSIDLKTLTPDSTIPDGNTVLFGADSQAAATPSVYKFDTIISFLSNSYFVANSSTFLSGNTITTNSTTLILSSAGLSANGTLGTSGQVLHSNGSAAYWATDDQGVTSVATGDGLSGGPITTTGTISVLANNGLVANATGIYAIPGNGIIESNSTGLHVGAGSGITVNSTTVAVLANNGLIANATGVYVTTGSTMTVNSEGVHVNNSVLLKVYDTANSQLFP